MKKKGFTLIEMMVVIIIIGIILVIMVPRIPDILEKAENRTFMNAARTIIRISENYIQENGEDPVEGQCYNLEENILSYSRETTITGGMACFNDGEVYLKHVTDGKKCVSGFNDDLEPYICGNKKVITITPGPLVNVLGNNRELPYLNFLVETNQNFSDTIAKKLVTTVTYPDNRDISGYTLWENFEIPYLITGFDVSPNFYVFDDVTINVNDYEQTKASDSIYIADGDYFIEFAENREIGLGLQGTNIISSTNKQAWSITKHEGGYYSILKQDNKNMSFDNQGANFHNNVNLQIYSYSTSGVTHRFKIEPTKDGFYRIFSNANTTFCVSNTNSILSNGDNVVLYQCNYERPQKFIFRRTIN